MEKAVAKFYVFLFAFYGISLKTTRVFPTEKFPGIKPRRVPLVLRLLRFTGSVIAGLEMMLILAGLLGLLYVIYYLRSNNNWGLTTRRYAFVLLHALTIMFSHLYVYFMAEKYDLGPTLDFLLKSPFNNNHKPKEENINAQYSLLWIYHSISVFLGVLIIGFLSMGIFIGALFYVPIIFLIYFGSFQSHCLLLFTILMEELTLRFRPSLVEDNVNNNSINNWRKEFMINYETMKKLSRKVNLIFSPVLAVTCVFSVSVFVMSLSLDANTALLLYLFPVACYNVISCVVCLISMMRCNRNRLQITNQVVKFLDIIISKPSIILIERQLAFNYWLIINPLINDKDFFDVGCLVPMDETILLMIFQIITDVGMSLPVGDLIQNRNVI